MGPQPTAREEELRSLFRSFDKGTGLLRAPDFEALLDAQHLAEDVVDPLPAGFAASVFGAWAGEDEQLTEESFIHGYEVYLAQRDLWIGQWLQSDRPGLVSQEASRVERICADMGLSDHSGGGVSEEQFGDFCARWAEEVGEVPPPRAFSTAMFEFLSSDGHFQPSLASSRGDAFELYAAEWQRWLRSWLEGRRKELGSRATSVEKLDSALASTACPSTLGDSSTATRTLAELTEGDMEDSDFEALFSEFDFGDKGCWSMADVSSMCKALWRRDGRVPPPDAFGGEALRYIRDTSRAKCIVEGVERLDVLTLEQVRGGWTQFRARRHVIFERWAAERYGGSVFACPCCQGHFTLRLESSGLEVAAVSDTGAPLFKQVCARTAADLLPPPSQVAALHDGISSSVGQGGAFVAALPRGMARPALNARLLLEASASGHPSGGAVALVASETQLHSTATLLAKLAPEQEVLWLQGDGWRPEPGATPPVLLSTPEVLHDATTRGRLQLEHLGFALCSCVEAEVPPLFEVVASAPLRLLGAGRPRVVCLLDEESQVHQALVAHVEAIRSASEHLQAAFSHLEAAEREFATDDTTVATFRAAAAEVLLEGSVCSS